MSSEWQTSTLVEIASNISRPFKFNDKETVIFINTGDVLDGGFLHREKISKKGLPGQAKKAIEPGDILYSEIRPGNKRHLLVNEESVDSFVVSTKFMVIKAIGPVSPEYLYLILTGQECEAEFKIIADSRSGTFPQVTFDSISYYPIRYPKPDTQQRIVEFSAALTNKIQLNKNINQTLEQMAQAIFKSWFVDFEPVKAKIAALEAGGSEDDALLAAMQAIAGSALFATDAADADAPTQLARLQTEHPEQYTTLRATAELFPSAMQESELGEIPEGWSTKSIYEIADVIYGAPFKSKLFNTDGNGLPLVRIRDLKNERPGVSTPELHPKGYLIQNGDLLVGMDGEFRPYIWGGNEAWMNQRVCTFKPKDKLSAALIKEFITRQLRFFELTTVATTVIHLGKGDIDSFTYLNPNSELLHICSKILEPLFQKVVSNKVEIISLEEIRDALLPKLLSGELSVNQDVD